MKKMNFEANQKEVLQFVEELQRDPLLEGYEINQSNANDFYILKEDKKNCASCNGLSQCKNMNEGYALFYEDSNFVLQPCRFKKEANRLLNENQKIKTLFISKSILSANLESFDITTPNRKKIYEHILKFLTQYQQNKFIKGLYLYGTFATGKTFILGCIANELARKGIESLIIYFPDLVVELKSSIGTSRLEELINYLKSVDVLFLDDLGSARFYIRNNEFEHRQDLLKKLANDKREEFSVVDELIVQKKLEKIQNKLHDVCDGNIISEDRDSFVYKTDKLDGDLKMVNLSTGMKNFAILKRLLQNGNIDENGIIILDEPEIHLHPEWQLKFAEIIVLLQKEFNANILLNTHSPYFLNAIEVFSEKYKIANNCKYYLAIEEKGSALIMDVTNETEKIYEKLAKPLQELENIEYGNTKV